MTRTYIFCRQCRQIHEVGFTCEEGQRRERAERRRLRRKGRRFGVCRLVTDTGWCRRGTVYPGINHDRPLEDRAAFQREIDEKGLVECSPGEIGRGNRNVWDRDMRQKLDAVTEKYAHA